MVLKTARESFQLLSESVMARNGTMWTVTNFSDFTFYHYKPYRSLFPLTLYRLSFVSEAVSQWLTFLLKNLSRALHSSPN